MRFSARGARRQLGGGLRALAAGLVLALASAHGAAGAGVLRVGTSGDYPPFSRAEAGPEPRYEGLDLALARAYAADRGRELAIVRFRWPRLLAALADGRFDVAMSGVTVRPERSLAGRFTVPVAETGAVALASIPERWAEVEDLDRPIVRIAVNAGGHLEQVARSQFPHATLIAVPDNAEVLRALKDGSVDAVVSDTAEALLWRDQLPPVKTFGPLTRDRKAWLVRADRADLAADLDTWLLARERDGTLARLRAEHLGPAAGPPVAEPLAALLAALDERLSLMPVVAVVKRRSGVPLEVPARESQVLDAATEAVLADASRLGVPAPSDAAVRRFFGAQLAAAKQVQRDAVRDPAVELPDPLPDLDGALRPALLRIGERIARLALALPHDIDRETVRAAADDALRTPQLSEDSRRALADAVCDLSAALPAAGGEHGAGAASAPPPGR